MSKSGKLNKLKLQRGSISKGQFKPDKGDQHVFETVINPEGVTHNVGRNYCMPETDGEAARVSKYQSANPEELSFTLVVDGTGVVPDPKEQSVNAQLKKLRNITYSYVGKNHEPPVVKINWGKWAVGKGFWGRLQSMNTEYTLFHRDGSALRAKVSFSWPRADNTRN